MGAKDFEPKKHVFILGGKRVEFTEPSTNLIGEIINRQLVEMEMLGLVVHDDRREGPSSLTHTMRVDSEGRVHYTPKDASFYG